MRRLPEAAVPEHIVYDTDGQLLRSPLDFEERWPVIQTTRKD